MINKKQGATTLARGRIAGEGPQNPQTSRRFNHPDLSMHMHRRLCGRSTSSSTTTDCRRFFGRVNGRRTHTAVRTQHGRTVRHGRGSRRGLGEGDTTPIRAFPVQYSTPSPVCRLPNQRPNRLNWISQLLSWAESSGQPASFGLESTGSVGAALFHSPAASWPIWPSKFPHLDRQIRRLAVKFDTIDAQNAAKAVIAGFTTRTVNC